MGFSNYYDAGPSLACSLVALTQGPLAPKNWQMRYCGSYFINLAVV